MIPNTIFPWLLLILFLPSCSKQSPSYQLHSERITSQHDSPVITYIETTPNTQLPTYQWPHPKSPIITHYAFHCHGSGQEALITESQRIFDCDGIRHSLSKDFFIHPRLVALTRWLQTSLPIQIIEGVCCPQHFAFLQHLGKSPSPKLLTGHAVIVTTPTLISRDQLLTLLPSFYKPKDSYPFTIQQTSQGTHITNHEFLITYTQEPSQVILTIEIT